jgi:transcriptional regulator with XRE-family HTH domain
MMRPDQCRAARSLLGWSQEDLEEHSGVAKRTIADFEREARVPHQTTLDALASTFDLHGVELIPENGGGAGVRHRRARPWVLFRRDAIEGRPWVAFAFDYRGARRTAFVTYQALEAIDLDRGRPPVEAFDRNRTAILLLAAELVDRDVTDAHGRILIEAGNINRPPPPADDDRP